jgi:homoserine O-acetyltransferase/O-succinyltransferase
MKRLNAACFVTLLIFVASASRSQELPVPVEGDYVAHDFHFRSGEVLPELRLHYRTLGQPVRDASGHVKNAVLIAHGTTGSGKGFLSPQFAGVLFGPGQLLDSKRYYIILPDAIGHGGSSKPSDGMHAKFPQYDYDDMVAAQHMLLTDGLKVDHLRLYMGTSMGCMHAFVFAETYPDYLDATMPLACAPVQIAGRNRLFRKIIIDAIRNDPQYMNGEYKQEPAALRTAAGMMLLIGRGPLDFNRENPTRIRLMRHWVQPRSTQWRIRMRTTPYTHSMPRGTTILRQNSTRSRLLSCS